MSEKQRSCMKKSFVKISRRPYSLWDIFYEAVCVCYNPLFALDAMVYCIKFLPKNADIC